MRMSIEFTFLTISGAILTSISSFEFTSPSEVLQTVSGRIRGANNRTDKDFIVGGLFAIHNAATGGGQCGVIRIEKGVERMEAMLYAIDIINQDESLLPELELGYDVRDTCASENIGLDESLDLVVRDQLDAESCENACFQNSNFTKTDQEAPTFGVVGASNSGVSVPVAGLLRLFTTPQISYASSSALLNNRDRYSYFYRTTPSDTLQARAMIDLLLHFKWTYISTIYSKDDYGGPGIDEVHFLAEMYNICIDLNEGILDSFSGDQFTDLAEKVMRSNAQIIIVFTTEKDAEGLFRALQPICTRNFTWIASDFWSKSGTIQDRYVSLVTGMIGFAPQTDFTPGFLDYFSNLTLDNNIRNPWFAEWYSNIASCSVDGAGIPCNRTQILQQQLQQGQRSPLVIDAVFAFAHALSDFLADNCVHPLLWFRSNSTCLGQVKELNGANLLDYIQRVNFTSPTGHTVHFDVQGNAPGSYNVVNLQNVANSLTESEASLVTVGEWNNFNSEIGVLKIMPSADIQFSSDEQAVTIVPESHCSRCPPGHFQRQVLSSCCGICDPCLGQSYSTNYSSINCSMCGEEFWGNNPLIGSDECVPVRESFLQFSHPYSIIIIIIAIIGLALVAATLIVFAINWNNSIVKASGREQMITLLIGVALSFVSAFFFVSPPQSVICGIQRWCLWSCFSIMFGALLVKVVRVARIFLHPGSMKKMAFTGPWYQVLFTSAIVALQCVILILSTSLNVPSVVRDIRIDAVTPNALPTVVVTCSQEHIGFLGLSLGYQSLLVLLCTIFGVLSFKYPENYNEAKHIALCTISISVIWIAFIITYFATVDKQELQNITVSLAVVTTGYAVLISSFGPRLHLILFKSKRSTKSSSGISKHDCTSGLNSQYVLENTGMEGGKGMAIQQCILIFFLLSVLCFRIPTLTNAHPWKTNPFPDTQSK